jgi:glycosyltransferase involved in cell wall biosynthesis
VDTLYPTRRFREFKVSSIPLRYFSDYDVVHLHGPTPFLSDLVLARNSHRVVYTHHAQISWGLDALADLYRQLHLALAKRADAVIVSSDDYARLFRGHRRVSVIRLPCRLQPPSRQPLKNDQFTVLYVGQLRPFKGVAVLIRAASILPQIKFSIVGDGYLRNWLMNMARDLSNVSFEGSLKDDDLIRSYERAHIICLPSVNTTEAYGLVLIEGSLSGAIPVASNLIGVRENVMRLGGFTFEPGDYISLAKIIQNLSEDANLRLNCSQKSRKAALRHATTFTPQYYANANLGIFKECMRDEESPMRAIQSDVLS